MAIIPIDTHPSFILQVGSAHLTLLPAYIIYLIVLLAVWKQCNSQTTSVFIVKMVVSHFLMPVLPFFFFFG